MEKRIVVVSRQRGDTKIEHRVIWAKDSIAIECDLDEFLEVLCKKMKRVYCTRKSMLKDIDRISLDIVADMKQSTIYGPDPEILRDMAE